MNYRPGDAYCIEFTTSNPTTLAAQDADALPVATANRNGADDAAFALTVTRLDTGRYKATGTVPAGYNGGDVVNVTAAATIAGITGKQPIDIFMIERAVELPSPAPAGYGPGGGAGTTAVTDLVGGSNRNPTNQTVQNNAGQPLQGATVTAYNDAAYSANPGTAAVLAIASTDANGHWTLNLPTGEGIIALIVAASGQTTQVLRAAFSV